MDHFSYSHGILQAESCSLTVLADQVGTPFYCYSTATLQRHFQVMHEALSALNPMICFAVKANSNLAVLATLAGAGSGADVVSEGEIRLALAAGIPAGKIVFSGVGKTREEMAYALEQGIYQFNVESWPEVETLHEVASGMNTQAAIAFRVNPDVEPGTHAKISTGQKASKFGIPVTQAIEFYDRAATLPGIKIQGVSVHIGSQLTRLEPFREAYQRLRRLVEQLRQAGHAIEVIDLGGGLGIPYCREEQPPLPTDYGAMVCEVFDGCAGQYVFEPGRLIAGNAGILVTKVIYVKESEGRRYVIVDAAMNDLLRPTLYEAHHEMVPVVQQEAGHTITADIVGPVCESGDFFAKDVELPEVQEGDLLAFRSAGAYGAVMSSTYNTRLLIPEILVNGRDYAVVRPRPTYEEILAQQQMPGWLG